MWALLKYHSFTINFLPKSDHESSSTIMHSEFKNHNSEDGGLKFKTLKTPAVFKWKFLNTS